MAENVRPPVAVRIARPYDTEDEFLHHELETLGRTSIILLGAQPRPTGVVLRFEVTLKTGVVLLRGEGRVLGFKDNAFRNQAGLTLRFTRLDSRSKGLVDRVTAIREARGGVSRPPPDPARATTRADPALTGALTARTPAPAPTATSGRDDRPSSAVDDDPTYVETRSAPGDAAGIDRAASSASMLAGPPSSPAERGAPATPSTHVRTQGREAALARLRERAARLSPERIEALLTSEVGGAPPND